MNDAPFPTYYSTDVDALSDQEITRYMGEIEASGVMCGHGEDLEREDYETGSWEDQAQNRWDALVCERNHRSWTKLSPDASNAFEAYLAMLDEHIERAAAKVKS